MIAGPERFKRARGKQPQFHSDPDVDQLFTLVSALLQEIAVLRDRIDVHERLAEAQAPLSRAGVDRWTPDPAAFAERQQARRAMIARALRALDTGSVDEPPYADALRESEEH